MLRPRLALVTAAVVAAAGLAACGGSGHAGAKPGAPRQAATPTAATLLTRAQGVVNATHAVHFVLTSSGVPTTGTELVGGHGDLVRPDGLKGSLTLSLDSTQVTVAVVATGGTFYAVLPLHSTYSRIDPSEFGFGNPADLLSTSTGVTALLADAAGDARRTGRERLAGELVDEVKGTVPGAKVPVIPDLARSRPVTLTAAIDPSTYQLRQVTLSGPFTSAGSTTTYTVTLSDYGEHVTVTAPTT